MLGVACSGRSADSAPSPPGSTQPVVGAGAGETPAEREVPLLVDAVRQQPGSTMSSAADSLVVESAQGPALLSFDTSGLRQDCIEHATLTVRAVDVDVPVIAWVSLESGLDELSDGASLGRYVIAQGSPQAVSVADGDTLTWDVSDLLRWNRTIQSTSERFVVALKPEFDVAQQFPGEPSLADAPAEFGAMEAGQGATLTVTESDPCDVGIP